MCRNGRYTEHGIKALDGFGRERFRVPVSSLVPVDESLGVCGALLEPASIVAKAWDQIDRIGARSHWTPRRVLVLGAGPVGLLAALLGSLRKLDVHVLDRVTTGPKPQLVASLGATYHTGSVPQSCVDIDIALECTGAPPLVFDAMRCVAANGIVCLTGVSSGARTMNVDAAGLNNELVLENTVVFGTVNANRRHYLQAAEALPRAGRGWLERLITRRIPFADWADAYEPTAGDVKTIITFSPA
jgi:threonine dehydrogenase-like Zn-dependent dehydrogenase